MRRGVFLLGLSAGLLALILTACEGAAGPAGTAGAAGIAGAAGPKGDAGPAGPKGDTGSAGPAGTAGVAGPKGDAGPAGPKGDTGSAADADAVVTIPLQELGGSGQFGSATLTARGNQTEVVVSVTGVTGAAAGTAQPAHIHNGNCVALGGVRLPLTNIENGKSVTLVPATLASIRNGGTAINLHKSATEVASYTACGEIPAAPSIVIALNEMNTSGQKGVAVLTAMGSKTQVVVSMNALPGAAATDTQPIHIHNGSCATLGSVKQALTVVRGGNSTTVFDAPLSSFRDGKFAINAHKSAAQATVYTACGDIPSMNGFAGSGEIKSNIQSFRLESFTVKVGTKVTWTNLDTAPHTATSSATPAVFDTANIVKDASGSFTFATAGSFPYFCKVHPTMTGLITVE